MFSSQRRKMDIVLTIYQDPRTVFRFNDVAQLVGETDVLSLRKKLNYYVHQGKFLNPRKGIYTKPDFNPAELACLLFTPSYISLEYVLQKEGIIFQYDPAFTLAGYLSREVEVSGHVYRYRKIKGEILVNPAGIIRLKNQVNMATAERAFLDSLYLNKSFHFDNLDAVDKRAVRELLPIYNSKALSLRADKILPYD